MIYENMKKFRYSCVGLSLIPSSAIMGIPMRVNENVYYIPYLKKEKDKFALCTELLITDKNHVLFYLNYNTAKVEFNADKLKDLHSNHIYIKDNSEIFLIKSIFGEALSKKYNDALNVYQAICE